jgi:hypothetical protein
MTDLDEAVKKVLDRLRLIDAAYFDIESSRFAEAGLQDLPRDNMTGDVLKNRVALLLLNLYHLRDDARGLARRKGIDKKVVDEFCENTPEISICIKAGDTYKHGIGGRDNNNTVIEHDVAAFIQQGAEPSPHDPMIGLFNLVIDENGDARQSNLLAADAMHEWIHFLENSFGLDLLGWRRKWTKRLKEGPGIYKAKLPEKLVEHIKKESSNRVKNRPKLH